MVSAQGVVGKTKDILKTTSLLKKQSVDIPNWCNHCMLWLTFQGALISNYCPATFIITESFCLTAALLPYWQLDTSITNCSGFQLPHLLFCHAGSQMPHCTPTSLSTLFPPHALSTFCHVAYVGICIILTTVTTLLGFCLTPTILPYRYNKDYIYTFHPLKRGYLSNKKHSSANPQ